MSSIGGPLSRIRELADEAMARARVLRDEEEAVSLLLSAVIAGGGPAPDSWRLAASEDAQLQWRSGPVSIYARWWRDAESWAITVRDGRYATDIDDLSYDEAAQEINGCLEGLR